MSRLAFPLLLNFGLIEKFIVLYTVQLSFGVIVTTCSYVV